MRSLWPCLVSLVLTGTACSPESHVAPVAAPDAPEGKAPEAADAEVSADIAAAEADVDSGASGPRQLDAQVGRDAAADLPFGDAASGGGWDPQLLLPDPTPKPCEFSTDAEDLSCTGFLCSVGGDTYAALEQGQPWNVGGLDWTSSLCQRALGWPSAMTSDLRYILYGLTARDQLELDAGIPLFVYWANAYEGPDPRARRCELTSADPLASCPATPQPPAPASFRGCRDPADPGCAVCTSFASGQATYRGAQPGVETRGRALR